MQPVQCSVNTTSNAVGNIYQQGSVTGFDKVFVARVPVAQMKAKFDGVRDSVTQSCQSGQDCRKFVPKERRESAFQDAELNGCIPLDCQSVMRN